MFFSLPSRVASPLAAAAFLAAMAAGRAEAQFGVGIAYPGAPFLYYTPERVPSPTDYLYDRDKARISAYGNSVQQQAATSQMASPSASSNAYFNHLRDYAGEGTYQVSSRQSLSRRTAPQARASSKPETRSASTRSDLLPLTGFFLPGGALDWPRDAPNTGTLRSAQAEVEAAVKVVLNQVRSGEKAKAQSVGAAKRKLVNYGQPAIAEVRSARSKAVADCFHYFLLFLHQALDQAAETGDS
ncbi:hypothetical protein V5E97_34845 [Singulisphaera sp. Ch08]|uniref:Uncharacterized protein n=1 Tax=Singulisphaera sp. Ch08 TaxID=3120278 RepID=A0AAU7CE28_9BACT